jgi:hypothetical protein
VGHCPAQAQGAVPQPRLQGVQRSTAKVQLQVCVNLGLKLTLRSVEALCVETAHGVFMRYAAK